MKLASLDMRHAAGVGAVSLLLLASSAFATHAQTVAFTSQMDIGATGAQVTALQTYLASNTSFYPEGLITGYYGSLTAAAVSRFQANYGLPAVGRVGPLTLAKLNEVAGGISAGADISGPRITNVTIATTSAGATIHWQTNELATGRVFFSSTPLVFFEATGVGASPTINGTSAMTDASLRATQDVSISGLNPNTLYFYMIQAVDASGNVSLTWPWMFRTNP